MPCTSEIILKLATKVTNHTDGSLRKTLEGTEGTSKERTYIATKMPSNSNKI